MISTELQSSAPVVAAWQAPAAAPPARRIAHPGQYLSFCVGAEEYGIDTLKVQEIRSYEEPTRMAGAPAFLRGVVNLRGVIVPIVDLRLRLDAAEVRFDPFTVSIIVNVQGRTVGVVVDSVSDVIALKAADILPPPALHGGGAKDFVVGIAPLKASPSAGGEGGGERLLILADLEQLLGSDELGLLDAVVGQGLCFHT